MRAWIGLAVVAAALSCTEEKRIRQGTALVSANVRQLWVSPAGEYVATLADVTPSKEAGAPADVYVGALTLAPAAGGAARRLGGGVTNLPGSLIYSRDGRHVAFLAGYSIARARGELRLARMDGGEPESLANAVSFYDFSRDGKTILWVEGQELFRRALDGGEVERLLPDVAQFELGPAGSPSDGWMLLKRPVHAKRELALLELATRRFVPLARGVGAYGFSPRGDRFGFVGESLVRETKAAAPADEGGFYVGQVGNPPRRVSREGATDFKFSPAADRVAFIEPATGKAVIGNLHVVDGDGEPRKVANRVSQILFGADGSLALLGAYELQAAAGTLGLLPPAGDVREIGRNVKQFSFTPKGRQLLFSQGEFSKGTYTLLLAAYPVQAAADAKARVIDRGVYGYVADEAERLLAYKTNCENKGKSCSLMVADLAAAGPSRRLVSGAAAFEFVPDGSGLVVVTARRAGRNTAKYLYTLGVISAVDPGAKFRVIDDETSGEFQLVGKDGARVAYLVEDPKRAGLYVADRASAVLVQPD